MLRETRKNALKNSGFEVRVLVDLVDFSGGFVLGPFEQEERSWLDAGRVESYYSSTIITVGLYKNQGNIISTF